MDSVESANERSYRVATESSSFDQRSRSGNICHSPPSRRNVSW
jgi:hypothetical protein